MAQEIMYEALNELNSYLARLNKGINDAVEYFRSEKEDEGIKLLIQIIEGLQWSMEVVFKTKPILEEYGINLDEGQLKELFKELISGLENKDYILIADLLEYEILELIRSWQEGLKKMQK